MMINFMHCFMKKKTVSLGWVMCGLVVSIAAQAQDKNTPDVPKPVFGMPIRIALPVHVVDPAEPSNLLSNGAKSANAIAGGQGAAAVIKPVILETWNVLARDITLSTTLTRWGQPGNYQVLWAASKDLPAMNATYRGTFEEALESLMEDTKHSGYPLHSCLYNNKVVRVLHATQSCDQ